MSMTYLMTPTSVVVKMEDGKFKPMLRGHPLFDQMVNLLKGRMFDKVMNLFDQAALIKQHSDGRFWVNEAGVIVIGGENLPESLSKRVLAFAQQGIDVDGLLAFWANLAKNVSLQSKNHLFAFLEHNDIPLTEDGYFIGYKRITMDWKDCHTKTFDNSIGKIVEMPRAEVNEDPNEHCSRGLHVCSYGYLASFSGDRIVEVKVNPADVVAVPNDYNGMKMRVCKYEVIRECTHDNGPRVEQQYPKFQEGTRVEVELDNGGYATGTVDSIQTSASRMNQYTVTLDTGSVLEVAENKLDTFEPDDLNADTDEDEDLVDEDDEEDFEEEDFDVEVEEDEDDEDEEVENRVSKLEQGQKTILDGLKDIQSKLNDQN